MFRTLRVAQCSPSFQDQTGGAFGQHLAGAIVEFQDQAIPAEGQVGEARFFGQVQMRSGPAEFPVQV